jgi:hypothetical protein
MQRWPAALSAVLFSITGAGAAETREPCAHRDPERRPFFGDLHVHTAYSQDASTQGTRATPRDAYRFARGEPLGIQPFAPDGMALRTVRLDRPLDFAAVTDHAEQIGEVQVCRTPGAPGHDSWLCRLYRGFPRAAFFVMNARYSAGGERFDFCGEGGAGCLAAARTVWQDTRDAAEGAYDRSAACRFTSFVAYEWTGGADNGKNLHRNVIFRDEPVPELPASVMETGIDAARLWDALQRDCVEGLAGCDVLTIPHNSNLDGGLMFQSAETLGAEIGAAEAARRSRWEPLVEVMQHKGDSECLLAGDTTDEACGFEKLPYDNFRGRYAWLGAGAPRPVQFVREALKRGLALEATLGANPFRYGLVASTDTHLGAAGLVSERDFPGHGGAGTPVGDELPPGLVDALEFGPGGLAVLWAEENTRDALFAAMQRREAYGTSGPRHVVRFFGGWSYPAELCEQPDFVARGYAEGVPMGGVLAPPIEAAARASRPADGSHVPRSEPQASVAAVAPRFAVQALQDPGSAAQPGIPLQRIQIVKGWLEDGAAHERVIEVAGGPNDAGVDLASCEAQGAGHARLCAVWSDPDFDPRVPAFWYARVLENPSCRWSQHVCAAARVDCGNPDTIGPGLAGCCDPLHRPTVQERAWTSPIWYAPGKRSAQ